MQAFGLAEDGARVLEQRAPGLGRRYALASAGQEFDAERVLHAADAGRSGGEREVGALGATGDAARVGDVTEKT